MTKILITLVGLAVVSLVFLFNAMPVPTIHFPGIVPLAMLACVVLLLSFGLTNRRRRL